MKKICSLVLLSLLGASSAFASEGDVLANAAGNSGGIAVGAALAIGLAAMGGALAQGKAIASTLEAIGRNPAAAGGMNKFFFVGLALIESLVILGFLVALQLIAKV